MITLVYINLILLYIYYCVFYLNKVSLIVLQVFQEPTMPMYKVLSHLEGRKIEPRRFHTDCELFSIIKLF